MCVCVCVFRLCLYVCMCMCMCVYMCVCVCMYVCICAYVCVCMFRCVYVCVCVCLYVCMCLFYVCVCMCVCVCVCVPINFVRNVLYKSAVTECLGGIQFCVQVWSTRWAHNQSRHINKSNKNVMTVGLIICKVKSYKVRPRTDHDGPGGLEEATCLYSFFNLRARLGWVDNPIPRPLYPWERPSTHYIGTQGRSGHKKSRPHTIRPPDRPSRSQSLYIL